jgi:hypothetical protein
MYRKVKTTVVICRLCNFYSIACLVTPYCIKYHTLSVFFSFGLLSRLGFQIEFAITFFTVPTIQEVSWSSCWQAFFVKLYCGQKNFAHSFAQTLSCRHFVALFKLQALILHNFASEILHGTGRKG